MGVARIFGFNFSGFFAWWMWRTIYLTKLPGLDKKIRVAFDWTLDLLFPKDLCVVHDLPHVAIPIVYGTHQQWCIINRHKVVRREQIARARPDYGRAVNEVHAT